MAIICVREYMIDVVMRTAAGWRRVDLALDRMLQEDRSRMIPSFQTKATEYMV